MNKRYAHHLWTKFRTVKPGYFLILTLIFGLISVAALRANNEHMVKLRAAVYTADKNNGNVAEALKNLQSYVTAHMNTNLSSGKTSVYPPIQLEYTYDRLVQAQSYDLSQNNAALYVEAQQYCEKLYPTASGLLVNTRVPCVEQYLQSKSLETLPPIADDLYKFDFISPTWSPDLAGWSLVITTTSGVVTIASFGFRVWLKRQAN